MFTQLVKNTDRYGVFNDRGIPKSINILKDRNSLGQFTSEGLRGNTNGFTKGFKPWNTGKKMSKKIREKQSKAKLEFYKKNGNIIGFQKGNKLLLGKTGRKCTNWKGGRLISDGYVLILVDKGKYKAEHRLVMEEFLRRPLEKYEKIHHINAIRNDNRITNLKIVVTNPHYGNVKCPFCRGEFLIQ